MYEYNTLLASVNPSPDASQIEAFMRSLYGDNAPGYIMLWTGSDKASQAIRASDIHQVAQTMATLAERDNVYFGIGLQAEPPATGRGKASGVVCVPGVWIDLDYGDGHKNKSLPPTLDDVIDVLAEVDEVPTLAVLTGGGVHAHWLFKTPWVFENEGEREQAASMMQGFQAHIRTLCQRQGWHLDSTHDLARVLRANGTLNHKSTPPKPVMLFSTVEDGRFLPSDFARYIGTKAAKAQSNGHLTLIRYDDDPADHWLDKALGWARNGEKDGRNAAGFDLACQLRDAGQSQGDASHVMSRYQQTVENDGDHPYTNQEAEASLEQAYSESPRDKAKSKQALAAETARQTIAGVDSVTDADEADTNEEDTPSPLLQDVADLGDLGWLDEYTDIASDLTNAPRSFNLLCGLATAAIAIQHRAVLRMSFDNIRPNIYGAIVAPSTVYHKTTALRQSQSLLNRAGLGHLQFASQFSSEGLLSCLAERPAGIIYRDEVGTLFASDRVKYLAPLKQDLTALYDGGDYSRQLARERITVTRPYLNILGATTPTRFYQGVTLTDWQDGFLARWLFALPDCEPDFDNSPSMFTSKHGEKLEHLAGRLREIDSQPAQDFTFDPAAFQAWDQWQRQSKKNAYLFGDDVVASIVGRYATYALKFAMILASLNGEFGRIGPKSIAQGIALADHYKASIHKLLEGRQNHGISGDKMQRVFAVITVKGPKATTKVIQQFAHMNASETRAVLDKLVEIGAVVSEKAGRGMAYTATTDKLPIRSW